MMNEPSWRLREVFDNLDIPNEDGNHTFVSMAKAMEAILAMSKHDVFTAVKTAKMYLGGAAEDIADNILAKDSINRSAELTEIYLRPRVCFLLHRE